MSKWSISLSIILVIFSIYLVATEDPTLMPLYILLLGFSIIPRSIKKIKNAENEDDQLSPYWSLTIFGMLFVYFLFLWFSGHLY